VPVNRSVTVSHLSMWRVQTDRATHSLPTYIRRTGEKTLSQGTGNSHRGRECTSRRFTCDGKLIIFRILVHFILFYFLFIAHSSLSGKTTTVPLFSVTCFYHIYDPFSKSSLSISPHGCNLSDPNLFSLVAGG
jgi:hypothetical protein